MEQTMKKDPYANREAKRYVNPIPSREFIMAHLEEVGLPLSFKRLSKELELERSELRDALKRRLTAMVKDGQLIVDRRNVYRSAGKMDLIPGRVVAHADGYGFLVPDSGSDDLYLGTREMRVLFHGDKVLARVRGVDFRGRLEAEVIEVVEHSITSVVGIYHKSGREGFVRPLNRRITQNLVVTNGAKGASEGQVVVARITMHPSKKEVARGTIIQVLGDRFEAGMETEIAIRNHDLPNIWPDQVLNAIDLLEDEVQSSDKKFRKDLRDLFFVTIDGEDARDFDDAVYCERQASGGWRLYVAIADVAHYVEPGTALDREAFHRGNSVYFPRYVVPMLPEKLSNGLCSLNPDVDRLCMVCEMTISARGRLSGFRFYEAIIHSKARLTYNLVGRLLLRRRNSDSRNARQKPMYRQLIPHLDALDELYRALSNARTERGALDFESNETTFVFDKEGHVEGIELLLRNEAHRLIEECMLCANVSAARFIRTHGLTGLYRVHDGPRPEKVKDVREFLGGYGLSLGGGELPQPADYLAVINAVKSRKNSHALQTVLLRSLSQAVYQANNLGHFGLNYKEYTHFTSPIRRYPDLLTHRAIKSIIHSRVASTHVERFTKRIRRNVYPYESEEVLMFGDHCSMTERRADAAVYEVIDYLKCQYIENRVGESFDGVITAVTGFGFFVELDAVYVEGLVHVSGLINDYFRFEPGQQALVGEKTGRMYAMGDVVRVQIARVDLEERKIDCELVSHRSTRRKRKAGKGSSGSAGGQSVQNRKGKKRGSGTSGRAKRRIRR
jgi:ribonuclease R